MSEPMTEERLFVGVVPFADRRGVTSPRVPAAWPAFAEPENERLREVAVSVWHHVQREHCETCLDCDARINSLLEEQAS